MIGVAGEDYLKAIYKLRASSDAGAPLENLAPQSAAQSRLAESDSAMGVAVAADSQVHRARVTTQALADRLGVAPPSATAMVKKLAARDLVRHTPYRGVELTPQGEKIALEIIRHHRLLETYLSQVLGVDWDRVHEEAERLEHVLSPEVEAKMDAALNGPTHDPHGAPIPTEDGRIARDGWQALSECARGEFLVRRVSDRDGALLRHLREIGLVPGARVSVVRAVREEGVLQLRVEGKRKTLGISPAQAVFVARHEAEND